MNKTLYTQAIISIFQDIQATYQYISGYPTLVTWEIQFASTAALASSSKSGRGMGVMKLK